MSRTFEKSGGREMEKRMIIMILLQEESMRLLCLICEYVCCVVWLKRLLCLGMDCVNVREYLCISFFLCLRVASNTFTAVVSHYNGYATESLLLSWEMYHVYAPTNKSL